MNKQPTSANSHSVESPSHPLPTVVPVSALDESDLQEQVAPTEPSLIVPPPAGSLSVDQAINACLLADPRLKAGLEAIRQSNGDWVQSSLRPNPSLNVSQTLLPLTRPFTVTRQGGPPQFDVGLAVPIDWCLFGKRAAAMLSAQRAVHVSEAEYANLIRERVLQTSLAYFDAVEAKAMVQIAQAILSDLQKAEEATGRAVENGGRDRVELQRIRLDVLAARRALRDAETAVVATKATLRATTGGMLIRDADVPSALPPPIQITIPDIDLAFAAAEQTRPDLQALRWQVSKGRADIDLQCRNGKPEITPKIGFTRQFQEQAIGFPDANSFGVGLDMTLPLYDRNQGNQIKAVAATNQAAIAVQAARIQLRAELETVTQQLQAAIENAASAADEQLQLAAEVRDSIAVPYEVGGPPLIDFLDAQRNYRETFKLFVTARADFWRAFYTYNAAVGQQVLSQYTEPDPAGATE